MTVSADVEAGRPTQHATDTSGVTVSKELLPPEVLEAESGITRPQVGAAVVKPASDAGIVSKPATVVQTPREVEVSTKVVEGEVVRQTEETQSEDTLQDGTTVRKKVTTTKHVQPVTTITRQTIGTEQQHTVDKLLGTEVDEHVLVLEPGVLQLSDDQLENETQVEESEDEVKDGTWFKRKVTTVTVKCKKISVTQRETEKPFEMSLPSVPGSDQRIAELPANVEMPIDSLNLNTPAQPNVIINKPSLEEQSLHRSELQNTAVELYRKPEDDQSKVSQPKPNIIPVKLTKLEPLSKDGTSINADTCKPAAELEQQQPRSSSPSLSVVRLTKLEPLSFERGGASDQSHVEVAGETLQHAPAPAPAAPEQQPLDSETIQPRAEPLPVRTPTVKPEPLISYDTVEGEVYSFTGETEKQETSEAGRTVTRRVKTIRYYQPVIHRTLTDGAVTSETPEDVLVGSYVDEYCFDAPPDVDVYSASVETQTSVDETEQTLEDGTWLRRKVTNVVAYLAVDEQETVSIRDAGTKLTPTAEISRDVPPDAQRGDRPDAELTRSTTEAHTEPKESPVGAVKAAPKSAETPVDTKVGEASQLAQSEADKISSKTSKVSADRSDLTNKIESHSPEELVPVAEELIMAVPNPRQERARPTVAFMPITSSFDEPEEFTPDDVIKKEHTAEQFAASASDLKPVDEGIIAPAVRPQKSVAKDVTQTLQQSMVDKKPEALSKSKVAECTEDKTIIAPESKPSTEGQHIAAMVQPETSPVTEELIVAVPNPREQFSRPPVVSSPITSSFDEPEEIIEEYPTVEQFAAPPCDLKPVEEATIAPSIRRPIESVKPNIKQTIGKPTSESLQQLYEQDLVKPTADDAAVMERVAESMIIASDTKDSTTEPVTEELITPVPNPRQQKSRHDVTVVPITSSFDEPEELLPDEQLIEEQQTAKQFATPECDLKPVEEDVIAPDVRPARALKFDSGMAVTKTVDGTPLVPVEKIKAASPETVQFQPSPVDSTAAVTDQPRTRPVLVLKTDSDRKPAPTSSTFDASLPPTSSSREPRRPRSANEVTSPRRYGMESPQFGISSKPRMRRESPLSFVERLGYPASPEDFDIPLFDEGRRQVRTRSKKMVTRKVRKVRQDGEVVEDIVTEEIPDYGYSDTSSMRSGGPSPAALSPRTTSASSLTSPLPVEPASPGADSVSSQSSLRVFTDTVEGEPEVVTDVQEREETLPDGRVIIRKIIRTRQKQTIVKRTVMEGPSADDEQPAEDMGHQLVAAGEDVQKPDIRTYSDAMDMRPSTETVSNDVEEVLPDGTVRRKLTTTTSTRQLKTHRTVVEGPYVPETVNQALQGEVLRPGETALPSPQSAPRQASKSSGSSRTSPRPKFRIAMESPTPPIHEGTVAGRTQSSSQSASHPHTQDGQSQ